MIKRINAIPQEVVKRGSQRDQMRRDLDTALANNFTKFELEGDCYNMKNLAYSFKVIARQRFYWMYQDRVGALAIENGVKVLPKDMKSQYAIGDDIFRVFGRTQDGKKRVYCEIHPDVIEKMAQETVEKVKKARKLGYREE